MGYTQASIPFTGLLSSYLSMGERPYKDQIFLPVVGIEPKPLNYTTKNQDVLNIIIYIISGQKEMYYVAKTLGREEILYFWS